MRIEVHTLCEQRETIAGQPAARTARQWTARLGKGIEQTDRRVKQTSEAPYSPCSEQRWGGT